MRVRRFLVLLAIAGFFVTMPVVGVGSPAFALTNANVIVVGSSECDGYTMEGHLASKLDLAGHPPSIICISASSPGFGIDVAGMDIPNASTVVLTAGLNVRPVPVYGPPAEPLYEPETDEFGYVTPAGFRALVIETIDALREQNVERIIWFATADNGHSWHDYYVAHNAILREEAQRLDFEVVSWDTMVDPSLFATDRVHYTDEGYEFFADTIAAAAIGVPVPSSTDRGPCSYLSKGVSAQVGADLLGISEQDFLDANPHWNPYWLYGGVVCEPVDHLPHPLSSGTPLSPLADVLLAYSPRTGGLAEFFLGDPSVGGDPGIIGPSPAVPSGLAGADSITWSSAGALVLYSSRTGEFRVLKRDAGGDWYVAQEMTGSLGWTHVVPGDYDGDGDTDLLFYRATDGLMRFYSIRPSGGFEPMTPAMYGNRGWSSIVAGDYDGDGRDDVYWYRAWDGLMRFYAVTASGRFAPISDAMNGTRFWSSIVEGRYDGENSGLLFYRVDGLTRFYIIDPVRGFRAISPVLDAGAGFHQVVSGEFDGDVADDVFWYRSDGSVMSSLVDGGLVEISGVAPMPQDRLLTAIPPQS